MVCLGETAFDFKNQSNSLATKKLPVPTSSVATPLLHGATRGELDGFSNAHSVPS